LVACREENQRNRKEKIEEGQICHGKYSGGDKKEKEDMALSKSCFVCFSFNIVSEEKNDWLSVRNDWIKVPSFKSQI
jgi:hypothetical protein